MKRIKPILIKKSNFLNRNDANKPLTISGNSMYESAPNIHKEIADSTSHGYKNYKPCKLSHEKILKRLQRHKVLHRLDLTILFLSNMTYDTVRSGNPSELSIIINTTIEFLESNKSYDNTDNNVNIDIMKSFAKASSLFALSGI